MHEWSDVFIKSVDIGDNGIISINLDGDVIYIDNGDLKVLANAKGYDMVKSSTLTPNEVEQVVTVGGFIEALGNE